jgi:Zn-dependent peptidase ImmA (M78 family)
MNRETDNKFNYERLEIQANIFASDLLLPAQMFRMKIDEYRRYLGIVDKGHGYIFVDDQPCNYELYIPLLSALSSYFEVSKRAVEIKLKRMGLLKDQRRKLESLSYFL